HPKNPNTIIIQRCGQLDGLYDHPGGTSDPIFIYLIILGIPGISIVKAITKAPVKVPFIKINELGAQKIIGARLSQIPTKHAIQKLNCLLGVSDRQPKIISIDPLIISLHCIASTRISSLSQID